MEEEVEQTPTQVAAAEAKIETALATVDKGKASIKVGQKGIAFETAAELYRMAQAFVQGGVAPKGSNPGGVMAAILKGRALGLDEITSVTQIMMISGRTMMAGALVLGLLKRAGINYRFHWTGEGNTRAAVIIAWDPSRGEGMGAWPPHTFSMGDAARAGLTSKKGDTWKAWPDEMLLWRAVSKMGRQQFPEVCAGIYVPGEIPGDPQVTVDAEVETAPPTPTVPDPLFADSLEDVPAQPVAPFASHAEADAALAEKED
jgi:hypothetical protein